MTIACLGPNQALAPSADPGDGLLDVVLVTDEDRALLDRYIAKKIEGDEAASAGLRVERARTLGVRVGGGSVRLDDHVHPDEDEPRPEHVSFRLLAGAVTLLMPAA